MKISFNPYSQKSPTPDYGVYFNLFHYYVESKGVHPSVYEFAVLLKAESVENVRKACSDPFFTCETEYLEDGGLLSKMDEICFEKDDALIFFHRKENVVNRYIMEHDDEDDEICPRKSDTSLYHCKILYQNADTLVAIKDLVVRKTDTKKNSNVHLLCSEDGMLRLQRFDVVLPEKMDLGLNYGEEASLKLDKIVSSLNNNKKGLILFSGDPGTGKSTFIKYLTTQISRKVIYLSSGAVEQLTSPDFMSFMMRHRNSILLLEDAEKALRSRDRQDNEAVSNILNITDGILGDCLNVSVIATFNVNKEEIDSALVRKGRLMMEHHFKALSEEEANRIFESMGSERRASAPMTLAEIYNFDDNFHKKEERKKVGF